MAIVKGKTQTGFSFKVDSDLINDAEFLELFAEMQDGNNLVVFKIIKKSLGEEQKQKLYDHVRNKKGQVPIDRMSDEVTDIFKVLSESLETKNS